MSIANWFRLGLLSILWGGSFLFVEIALTGLPPLSVVWLRVSLAAVVLGAVLWVRGPGFPKGWAVWAALCVMGLLNNAIPFSLFVYAQGQITGALASILNATTPLFAVMVAHLATADEKVSPCKGLGLLFGLFGVMVTVGSTSAGPVLPVLACLGAALSYGVAGVWGRRFRTLGVAPLSAAYGQLVCSTMMLLPLWIFVDRPWMMSLPEAPVLGAVIGIAVFSSALAYLIYFRLLAEAGATNLSLVTFVIPISATFLGWLVLGETLLPRHIAGFALIGCGLLAIDGRLFARHK